MSRDRLALFFTRGVSLASWDANGSLDRELALYRLLAERLDEVALLTYGGAEERRFADRLGPLTLAANERGLPRLAYEAVLPLAQARLLRRMTVLKTNQLTGGRAALRASRLHRVPLIARCGYLRTEVEPPGTARHVLSRRLERALFRGAAVSSVTTERLRNVVAGRYGVPRDRVHVVPNPVDVERFRPPADGAGRAGVVYVGRLAREKRVHLLIDAAARAGAPLRIVGSGPLEDALRAQAARLGADVEFAGVVPNDQLPPLLARSAVFALASEFEGHPKALLEAMAAGAAVVAADVRGIREVVAHEQTGLLAAPDGLATALERALADTALRGRLGVAARESVAGRFSYPRVLELELDVVDAARRAAAR